MFNVLKEIKRSTIKINVQRICEVTDSLIKWKTAGNGMSTQASSFRNVGLNRPGLKRAGRSRGVSS